MDCEYYRELISCLIDGELSEDEEAALADHLEICPECAAMHAAFSQLSSLVAEDMEEAPVSLCANVMAELRRAEIVGKSRRKSAIRSVLATAACAVIAIAAGKFVEFKAADTSVSFTKTAVYDVAVMPESETFAVPADMPAETNATNGAMFMAAAPMEPAAVEEAAEDSAEAQISSFSMREPSVADTGSGNSEAHDWQSLSEFLSGVAVEEAVQLPDYPVVSLTAFHEGVYYSLSFFEAENGLYYFDPMDGVLKHTDVTWDILANF